MNEGKEGRQFLIIPQKERFAEIIHNPPQIDLSEAIRKANLDKGGTDRIAEILTVKK